MNNTTRYIIGGLAGFSLGFFFVFFLVKPAPPQIITSQVIDGTPDTTLSAGVGSVTIEQEKYSEAKIAYPLPILPIKDEAYFSEMFSEENLNLQIDVITYPAADSIDLKYFSEIKHRSYERVDTVFISRVDTLIRTVQLRPGQKAFYDSFEFGFGTAAAIIATILIIFK